MSLKLRSVLFVLIHLAALAAIMVSLGREHSVMQHFIERQLRATDRHLRAHGLQVALLQEDTAAVEYLIMRRQSDIQAYKLAAGQAVAALATLVQEDPDDTADGYARIGRVHDRYGAAICETIAHPPPKGPEAEKVAAGIQEQTLELSQLLSDRLTGDDQKLGTLELSVRDALAGFRRAVFVYAGLFVLVVMAMTGSLAASVVGAAMGLDRGMKAVMAGDLRTRLETLEAGGPLLGQPAELREVFYCFDQMVSRLAEIEEMRSQFLGTVTHDIRTPLSSCLLHLDALGNPAVPEDVKARSRQMMGSSLSRMVRLADSLLELMRMEHGQFKLLYESVDLSKVIAAVVEENGIQAAAGKKALSVELAPDLPIVEGDPEKIHAILGNLIGNAVKFTPRGGSVAVRAQVEAGIVRVAVLDSGPGIPPEERKHLFEKFGRVASPDIAKRGVGLGLFIAREFTLAHGGRIWLEETTRPGCTFLVELPVRRASA